MDLAAGATIHMPMNQRYLAIISGVYKGLVASLARAMLTVLTIPYGLAVGLRNLLYDLRIFRSYSAQVPVVCVGNLACGGTGKTPTVIALVKMLQDLGRRPAILTRGYKGSAEKPADEVLLFAQSLPNVPVIVNPDRVDAARRALNKFDIDVLVMDDGFGHRRLRRDLDIVLLAEPLENVRLLPRGLYREPASSLKRADIVIKTYEPLDNPDDNYAVRQPTRLVSDSEEMNLQQLQDKKVLAFCAIAKPDSFEHTLTQAGAKLCARRHYPDHHRYRQQDLDDLARLARRSQCSLALTTMKDWVKIQHDQLAWPQQDPCPLWALDIEMSFSDQTRKLLQAKLKALFAGHLAVGDL